MGLRPGKVHATAAGLSETVGGTLFAIGALTPLAASMLTGTMAVAVDKVHRDKGVWNTEGAMSTTWFSPRSRSRSPPPGQVPFRSTTNWTCSCAARPRPSASWRSAWPVPRP